VIAEIDLPEGATLKTGKAREENSQLDGWSHVGASLAGWGISGETSQRTRFSWVVEAPPGEVVRVTVRHDRAGTLRVELPLT
jgi:hypothetical protein